MNTAATNHRMRGGAPPALTHSLPPPSPPSIFPFHTPAYLPQSPPSSISLSTALCTTISSPDPSIAALPSLFLVCGEYFFMVCFSFSLVNHCNLCFPQALKGSLDRTFILPFFVSFLTSSHVHLDMRHWGRVSLIRSLTFFFGLLFLVY